MQDKGKVERWENESQRSRSKDSIYFRLCLCFLNPPNPLFLRGDKEKGKPRKKRETNRFALTRDAGRKRKGERSQKTGKKKIKETINVGCGS